MAYVAWAARLIVAVVFALAAYGKSRDRQATRRAASDFGVPARWVAAVAVGLPIGEGAVALTILPAASAAWAAAAAVALLSAFSLTMLTLLARGRRPACACFGTDFAPISPWSLLRNAVLLAVTVLALWGALAYPAVPQLLPTDHAIGMTLAVILAAVQVRQHLALRALRSAMTRPSPSTPMPGLPVGAVAPEFTVTGLDTTPHTLKELLGGGLPLAILFVHPGCGPCKQIAAELPHWRQLHAKTLDIAVISTGIPADNTMWQDQFGIDRVLLQQSSEVGRRYRLPGIPSAVLIDPAGHVAVPAAIGPDNIRKLFAPRPEGSDRGG